ncbi:helix-turn-helix domain-containing protein [Neobacillus sp. D3-1R]|uniref:helix-turn-helix domain-containing protein n=1 Tax=Neobacillus sp. D3-1R TaxID=3445778 RepID=UPI003FA196FD
MGVRLESRLSRILKERNITEEQLVEMTGITLTKIKRILKEENEKIYLEEIAEIAFALKITDLNEIYKIIRY